MTKNTTALIKLHLAVFVAGLTGLFGKLVSMSEIPLVWYRCVLSVLLFALILHFNKKLKLVPFREMLSMAGVGALLGIHWILFYASIRLSNVSVGVVCYALVGFYTALFDPLVNHRKFDYREFLFSSLTLAGLLLIFHFDTKFRMGILVGAVSSALASLYTVCNKHITLRMSHSTSTFLLYEMLGGAACLTVFLPFSMSMSTAESSVSLIPGWHDFLWLLVLASVCTVGQYILQLQALRVISSFTLTLTYNLEPVYSMLLAFIFFNELSELSLTFFAGIALIITSVLLQNWITLKRTPQRH